MSVIVVGAGIAGLSIARRLALEGLDVTLLEKRRVTGGLAAGIQGPEGVRLDRFPLSAGPHDETLFALLADLGLEGDVREARASMACFHEGRHWSLSSLLDLWRFRPLSLAERVRTRLFILRARSKGVRMSDLDKVSAVDWVRESLGAEVVERLWRHVLEARFGKSWRQVPALWLADALSRGAAFRSGRRFALRGGMQSLVHAIEEDLLTRGVAVEPGFPVDRVEVRADGVLVSGPGGSCNAARVVLAVPMTEAQRMLQAAGVRTCIEQQHYEHQGVLSGVFLLDRPLKGTYWTAVINSGSAFRSVVEMTALRPPREFSGQHVVYVTNRARPGSREFQESDESVLAGFQRSLLRLYPELKAENVRHSWLFRSRHGEPIYSRGYLLRKPPLELIPSRVYLLNACQLYPRDGSIENRLWLAERAAAWVLTRGRMEAQPDSLDSLVPSRT